MLGIDCNGCDFINLDQRCWNIILDFFQIEYPICFMNFSLHNTRVFLITINKFEHDVRWNERISYLLFVKLFAKWRTIYKVFY